MRLSQNCGDSRLYWIPLFWERAAFEPGNEWGLLFTAKRTANDPDDQALIQKTSTAGITLHAEDAALVRVECVHADTRDLEPGDLVWDIQAQHRDTGEVRTVAGGRLTLVRDITRATTPSIPVHTSEPPILLGAPGKSAYQMALDDGFVGTLEQWRASLKGEPGTPGTPGTDLIKTNITTLTGTGSNALAAIPTAVLPALTPIGVIIGGQLAFYQLVSTSAQTAGHVRPNDYPTSLKTWRQCQ